MGNDNKKVEPKKVKESEFKTYVELIIIKIGQQKQKKIKEISNKRKEIGTLLVQNQLEIAKLKMENIITCEKMIIAFDILVTVYEVLKEKVTTLLKSDQCPDDLRSTIDTVIYCADRIDIAEMQKIKDAVQIKYGVLFVNNAKNNVDGLVNTNIIKNLSLVSTPTNVLINKIKQITIEDKIDYIFPPEFDLDSSGALGGNDGKSGGGGGDDFFPSVNSSVNTNNQYNMSMQGMGMYTPMNDMNSQQMQMNQMMQMNSMGMNNFNNMGLGMNNYSNMGGSQFGQGNTQTYQDLNSMNNNIDQTNNTGYSNFNPTNLINNFNQPSMQTSSFNTSQIPNQTNILQSNMEQFQNNYQSQINQNNNVKNPSNMFPSNQSQVNPSNMFQSNQNNIVNPSNMFPSNQQTQVNPSNMFPSNQSQVNPSNMFQSNQNNNVNPSNMFPSNQQTQVNPSNMFPSNQTQVNPSNMFPSNQSQVNPSNMFPSNQSQVNPSNMYQSNQNNNVNPSNMFPSNQQTQVNPSNMFPSNQSQVNPSNMYQSIQNNNVNPSNMFPSNQQSQVNPSNMFPSQSINYAQNNEIVQNEIQNNNNLQNDISNQSYNTFSKNFNSQNPQNSVHINYNYPQTNFAENFNQNQSEYKMMNQFPSQSIISNKVDQSIQNPNNNQSNFNLFNNQSNVNPENMQIQPPQSNPSVVNQSIKEELKKNDNILDSMEISQSVILDQNNNTQIGQNQYQGLGVGNQSHVVTNDNNMTNVYVNSSYQSMQNQNFNMNAGGGIGMGIGGGYNMMSIDPNNPYGNIGSSMNYFKSVKFDGQDSGDNDKDKTN